MTTTQVRGVSNEPTPKIAEALRATAARMERVRAILGHPVIVTSGYRSATVNKAVGGSMNSAHMTGHAVDFICPKFGTPLAICKELSDKRHDLEFDQLIEEEGRWVHISFKEPMRGEVLTRTNGGYVVGLKSARATA
jgi:putative chitinase